MKERKKWVRRLTLAGILAVSSGAQGCRAKDASIKPKEKETAVSTALPPDFFSARLGKLIPTSDPTVFYRSPSVEPREQEEVTEEPTPTKTLEPTSTPFPSVEPTEQEEVTEEPTPTKTLGPTSTPVPSVELPKQAVLESTPSFPTATPTERSTSTPMPPAERAILKVPLDAQDLSLSCESGAAAMIAAYFGVVAPQGFDSLEDYFIKTIPENCNPHEGYRGLISGALSTSCDAKAGLGYGVYAEPVAAALQRLGVQAKVNYGVSYDWVATQIKAGRPVAVWISGKDVQPEYEVDSETGQKYVLYLGEHLWVISGVEKVNGRYRFRVNDTWKGRQYWVWGFPHWDVFGNMSVVAGN